MSRVNLSYTIIYNLQRIRYAFRHFVKKTPERKDTDVSLCEQLVIFTYSEKIQKNLYDLVAGFFRAAVCCCAQSRIISFVISMF